MLKGAGNRLVVSPWFAVGAGVVIATGALIYTPHNLDFEGAIQVTHCKLAKCPQPTAQGGAGLPAVMGGERVTASPSAPASLTVWYQPLPGSIQSGFSVWIKFQAPHSPKWKVTLVFRGAKGSVYVYDVSGVPRWQPYLTDGVTVGSVTAGTESVGAARISGQQNSGDGGQSSNGIVLFQVRGGGTPSGAPQCSYSGGPCQLRLSQNLASANSPGGY